MIVTKLEALTGGLRSLITKSLSLVAHVVRALQRNSPDGGTGLSRRVLA